MSATNLCGLRAARKSRVEMLPGDEYVHPAAALAKPQVAGRGDARLGPMAHVLDVDERHGALAQPMPAIPAADLHHSTAVRYRVRSTAAASWTSSAAGAAGAGVASGSGSGSGARSTGAGA